MAKKIKMPNARQLPSGSWRCEIYINGRRASFVEPTEYEAVKAGLVFKLTVDASDEATEYIRNNLTLTEAIDVYVAKRTNILSPSTVRGYKQIQKNRFKSVMDSPISAKHDWQYVINEEAANGISAKTISNSWGLIRSVLIENNIDYKQPKLPQIIKKEIPFLQPDQIKPFLEAIQGDRFEMAYLLCLHSLRRSEMLAVKKENISDNKIHVEGSVVMDKDGKMVEKETNKNSFSRRTIPIFIDRLNELVESAPEGTLVPHAAGNMFDHLKVICKNNNLPKLGFHSLRHSFASLCYHLGISEMGCQSLGGWEDPSTMRKIYTHLAEIDKKAAEEKLKSFFI